MSLSDKLCKALKLFLLALHLCLPKSHDIVPTLKCFSTKVILCKRP